MKCCIDCSCHSWVGRMRFAPQQLNLAYNCIPHVRLLVLDTRHTVTHHNSSLKAKLHYAILIADGSEAGRRPATSC